MSYVNNTGGDMFSIVLTKEAEADLNDIFHWYEEQKEGLGFTIIEYFEIALFKLSGNPFYGSFLHNDARGVSLKKFPYEVVYRINSTKQQVRIIAIIHQHRNPDWFRNRIN